LNKTQIYKTICAKFRISNRVFIIYLSDRNGTTSKLEMGAGMILSFIRGKPSKIYSVGDFNDASPWLINPRVIRKKSIEEVIKDLVI
jgi:hypothetical protein